MAINHISLMGTVSKAPEFRMTQSGIPTANFTLAVVRPARQEGAPEVTDYVRCVVWRQLAEKVNETIHKDALVVVEGRLTTRSYETNDGQRRKVVEVEATHAVPVGTGGGALPTAPKASSADPDGPIYDDDFGDLEERAPAPRKAAPAAAPAARSAPAPRPPAPPVDFDDEIPF